MLGRKNEGKPRILLAFRGELLVLWRVTLPNHTQPMIISEKYTLEI